MAEKRYYWLKLKEDYFNSPKIKKLRKIAGGDTYTIIYLKMQLLSIKNKGIIEYEKIEPTFEEELALKLDEDVENVKITLAYIEAQGLIDKNENDEFLLFEASNNVGSECESAERVRQFRERENQKLLQCNGSVTEVKRISISNSNSISNNIYIKIIDYLNNKAGTHFKPVESNLKFIKARLKDYSEEDIKAVIDKKVADWKGTDMQKYIRPETLFNATKFESYLNEKEFKNKKFKNQREYSEKEIQGLFTNLEDVEV